MYILEMGNQASNIKIRDNTHNQETNKIYFNFPLLIILNDIYIIEKLVQYRISQFNPI